MKPPRWTILSALLLVAPSLAPDPQITILHNQAETRFPDSVVFSLEASASQAITGVVLEFGTDALACGLATDRVTIHDIDPASTVQAEWRWDLRRTGALPPGTTVWWHWVVRSASGEELTTPDRSITVEDRSYAWRQVVSGPLRISWYAGDAAFADDLMRAAKAALATIRDATGITFDRPIRAYIYADPRAMQQATLFAPEWSGGLAFPQHSTVLIAIAPDELAWGRRAVAHELTHVVVGHYTFSCLDSTPPWVSEGLAMYTEGEPDSWISAALDEAIDGNRLLPLRSLSQGFSNDPGLANLSYAQSLSLVTYLVDEFGPTQMIRLLDEFRAGTPEDQALQRVFGFNRDGLESAWRAHLGAPPAATRPPADKPTFTPYPTFAPIVGGTPAQATPAGQSATPTPPVPPVEPPGMCASPGLVGAAGLILFAVPRARRTRRGSLQGRPG